MASKNDVGDVSRRAWGLRIGSLMMLALFMTLPVLGSSHEHGHSRRLSTEDVDPAYPQQDGTGLEEEEEGRLISLEVGNLNGDSEQTGTIVIQTKPSWAPIGVERFHDLVDSGFLDGCRFFRVVPNFVVQFGLNGDPKVQKSWEDKGELEDDPVVSSNRRGTITFATAGPNTRTTQLFINLVDNDFLDRQGFSPIGTIVSGMNYVKKINSEYGEGPSQSKIVEQGNEYLEDKFPRLSFIESAEASQQ